MTQQRTPLEVAIIVAASLFLAAGCSTPTAPTSTGAGPVPAITTIDMKSGKLRVYGANRFDVLALNGTLLAADITRAEVASRFPEVAYALNFVDEYLARVGTTAPPPTR